MNLFHKAATIGVIATGAILLFGPTAAMASEGYESSPRTLPAASDTNVCNRSNASQSGTNAGILNGLQLNVSDVVDGNALALLGIAGASDVC